MHEQATATAMASLRRAYSPTPGAKGAKECTCSDCGKRFWQWNGKYKDACVDCSALRMVQSVESMRRREGLPYLRWLQKQQLFIESELDRLGATPPAD